MQQQLSFMNCSGGPIAALMRRLRIAPEELLVIYDDLDLPLGRLRLRRNGGSGGHRGVASVMAEVGSGNFGRLRIGIGRGEHGAVAHVLAPLAPDEEAPMAEALSAAAAAAKTAIYRGLSVAMNQYNSCRSGGGLNQPNNARSTEEQT